MSLYADVVVPRHFARSFTYLVPEALRPSLHVGDAVLVPFGPVTVRGLVVELRSSATGVPHPEKLRMVMALSREGTHSRVDRRLLELARWIADYYLAPLGQCLRLILPPAIGRGGAERYSLTTAGRQAIESGETLSEAERVLLQALAGRLRGASFPWLKKHSPLVSRGVLTTIMERGYVQAESASQGPQASKDAAAPASPLVPDGAAACEADRWADLESSLRSSSFSPLLLETEQDHRMAAVLWAIETVMATNRRAIILAPEVRRVMAIGEPLWRRWGHAVELWHAERPASDRARAWRRIRSGEVRIVVGTRGAVMAPIDRVGLVCVDEEDHPAYKDEQEPRYHARDVAWRRAELEQATLLLMSSHASLEARSRIQRAGGRHHSSGPVLIPSAREPVEVIPLAHPPHAVVLSPGLERAIRETLDTGGRVALYLNRRGYAPALLCTACRMVPRCPRCQVALTYSQEARSVRCRACGFHSPAPDHCPGCRGTQFDLIGCGTERLEADVRQRFPTARVRRWDRDTSKRTTSRGGDRPSQPDESWHIAIGTKLMVREIPPRSCALVGVVYAEAGLHVPDFRASERAYQELSDVASLANLAMGGRVLMQTCLPTHPVIRALATGDRSAWEREEIALREALDYPPVASLIALEVTGQHEKEVREMAERWAGLLQAGLEPRPGFGPAGRIGTLLGPVQGAAARSRGRTRWRLLVKGRDPSGLRAVVRRTREAVTESATSRRIKLTVDVDPLDLT